MINLSKEYIIQKFQQYSPKAHYISTSNSWRGKCVSCFEGKSFDSKTRLNYYIDKNLIICYNCSRCWQPYFWIKEITHQTDDEIKKEIAENFHFGYNIQFEEETIEKKKAVPTLPHNSINLSNEIQIHYYRNEFVVKDALKYIHDRRLDTAVNQNTFYISLTDFIHSNRLVIPFVNQTKKIDFYQSRAIYKRDEYPCKYLSKLNSPKSIFGLSNIDPNLSYLFIFEGPIDSCFVKNGISMAGLQMTEFQRDLLQPYFLFQKIWVLDNQLDNSEVIKKNIQLIERGETVFIWPKKYKNFKDVNELCCCLKIDEIQPDFFIKNSFSGLLAKTKLLQN